jgi:hypothetical protein
VPSILVVLSSFAFLLTNAQYARNLVGRQDTSTGLGSVDPSSTFSGSAVAPSQTATLILHTPDQLVTCQSDNITWDYAGPLPAQLTLGITDINIDQNMSTTPPPTIFKTLGFNIDATAENWTWQQVNVPSGYYVIEGGVPDVNATTEAFFIMNGSDTSCLPTQSATPSQTPVSGSSKKTNVAAIAGGTVGGVVVVAVAIMALLLWHRRNRVNSRHGPAVGRWGGLGSSGASDAGHHGPSESMGGILNDIGPAIATAATAGSRDDFTSAEDEKPELPITSANRHDSVTSLPYPTPLRRASTASLSHNQINQSHAATALQHDLPFPMPFNDTEGHKRGSVDVADLSYSLSAPGSRLSHASKRRTDPPTEIIPMDRSASGNRRASRKPVPQYDATEIEVRSSLVDMPPELPTMNPQSRNSISNSPKQKSIPLDARPMHYLIPDMPPSGKP